MHKFAILLLIISPILHAQEFRAEVMEKLVLGNFFIIGKTIGNKNTYYGEMSIEKNDSGLEITRYISGIKIKGTAAIELATPDKIPVLRFRFTEKNLNHEATCIVGSDLNNFARITCQVYLPGNSSMDPGMEALFINYNKPW